MFVNSEPWPDFYQMVEQALDELGPQDLKDQYGFCALPPASYHVTAWDGLNDGNLALVRPQHAAQAGALLDAFGASASPPASPLLDLVIRDLASWPTEPVTFRFDALVKRDALTLCLKPATGSITAYDDLVAVRAELSRLYLQEFGIAPANEFVPHVSLGYFANPQGIEAAQPLFPEWNELFHERLAGLTLTFESIAPYSFADMARFDAIAESSART